MVARRRRADIFRPLHVEPVHVLLGEDQILWAGLAIDLEAARAGPGNLLHRLAIRDMDDHHRHVDQLGQRDGTMRRLALDRDWP
ncbi:hypothetical protein D3C87_1866490 [compost metagenome]